jgi:hypothetical protein
MLARVLIRARVGERPDVGVLRHLVGAGSWDCSKGIHLRDWEGREVVLARQESSAYDRKEGRRVYVEVRGAAPYTVEVGRGESGVQSRVTAPCVTAKTKLQHWRYNDVYLRILN